VTEGAAAAGFLLYDFRGRGPFAAEDVLDGTQDLPQVFPIKRVNVDRVPRGRCVQCQLGLPFTEKHRNDMLGLRSYDAWEILSHVPWSAESYGPARSTCGRRCCPTSRRCFRKFR